MEIKIEVTQEEIEQRKKEWIDARISSACDPSYWEMSGVKNQVLEGIRTRSEYDSHKLYLTPKFIAEIQETLRDEIKGLVDKEMKDYKRTVAKYVKNYVAEKIESIAYQVVKEIMVVLPDDFENDIVYGEDSEPEESKF